VLERAIEAVLFVAPLLGLLAWRFLLPRLAPPGWLLRAGVAVTLLLIGALAWLHQQDQANVDRDYVPAALLHGKVVSGHAGAPLSPPALDGHTGED
jgi:anti-sigma factor RsiW